MSKDVYSICVKSIRQMIGASARFDLLWALHYQHRPVGLRELARLAGVHPHSAERMLKELTEEGVVNRKKQGARVLHIRNAEHPDWFALEPVFSASEKAMCVMRRNRLNDRARTILPFIDEASRMLKCARRTVRVT